MANEALNKKVIEAAKKEIGELITENMTGIMKSYEEAYADSESDKFAFQVPCGLILSPAADDVKVRAKIGYGVKHSDETIGTIATLQPDMFDVKEG